MSLSSAARQHALRREDAFPGLVAGSDAGSIADARSAMAGRHGDNDSFLVAELMGAPAASPVQRGAGCNVCVGAGRLPAPQPDGTYELVTCRYCVAGAPADVRVFPLTTPRSMSAPIPVPAPACAGCGVAESIEPPAVENDLGRFCSACASTSKPWRVAS